MDSTSSSAICSRRGVRAGALAEVAGRLGHRPAHDVGLVLSGPAIPTQPGEDVGLRVVPEVLGIHEQAVHVEEDGMQRAASRGGGCGGAALGGAHRALKYFASGWWTMIADVDCSGCSWNSSESSTPIRPGARSSTSLVWSSKSGHAGYPNE